VGNVQNTGRFAKMPKPATQSEIIFSVGLSSAVETAIPASRNKQRECGMDRPLDDAIRAPGPTTPCRSGQQAYGVAETSAVRRVLRRTP